jgi:phosphoglycolate phosphatase
MNVILFDIDGTLMLTDRAGQKAMEQVVPAGAETRKASGEVDYAGRTDRSIVADHLRRLELEDTVENFFRYTQDFLQRLPASLADRDGFVLPGVIETLERLAACSSIYLGLLTGNLRQAARMKLAHYDLDKYFCLDSGGDFVGGFGDEHHDRDDVARMAFAAACTHFHSELDPTDVWIVGDTPNDVRCARAVGANVLAVSTGGYSETDLSASQPDLVATDLAAADEWWHQLRQANPTLDATV